MRVMGWLHIWVLFYHSVLAEPFSSVPLWVSKVEDEQGVVGFYYYYLSSMHWPCFGNSPQILFGLIPSHLSPQVSSRTASIPNTCSRPGHIDLGWVMSSHHAFYTGQKQIFISTGRDGESEAVIIVTSGV